MSDLSGILVVNKKEGMTSRDVVNIVSKKLGIKKVGHTGTLDPLATGVLVLTIGKATKISEELTASYKEYIAEVKVGILTDTLDITGNVMEEDKTVYNIDYEKLISSFKKTYMQEVPIYSAVKVNGKKLYEYARRKEEVTLPKKEVEIKEIELLESGKNYFKFRSLVSKGTYIRSLIRDMGNSIDRLFTMTSLVRTKQGNFSIEDSYTIEDILNDKYRIIPIEEVLRDIPYIEVDDKLKKKIENGVKLENAYNIKDKVVFISNNKAIAIYIKNNSSLKVYKMLN